MSAASRAAIAGAWATIVRELGYDLDDPHLKDSPDRVARFLLGWHTKSTHDDPPKLTTFAEEDYEGIVATGEIPFYALCAHHGLPFQGTAAIGYIPKGRVLGLSKFARVLDFYAHRFTTQERITCEVAAHLERELVPQGVAVVLRAEHLCMSLRGVQKPGHETVTSDVRGLFRADAAARAEFFDLVRR